MPTRTRAPRPPAVVRYKNTNTGRVATYARPMPRLERSQEWRRCDEQGRVGDEHVKAAQQGNPAS